MQSDRQYLVIDDLDAHHYAQSFYYAGIFHQNTKRREIWIKAIESAKSIKSNALRSAAHRLLEGVKNSIDAGTP